MAVDDAVLPWLLDSDPALRWQVERDLAAEPEHVWAATRSRVATEGFGARLLARRTPTGSGRAARTSPPMPTSTRRDSPGPPRAGP